MGRTLWSESAAAKWQKENLGPLVSLTKATQTDTKPDPAVREDILTWRESPFDVDAPLRDDHVSYRRFTYSPVSHLIIPTQVYEAFIDPLASISLPPPHETEETPTAGRTDCPESGESLPVDDFDPPVTPSSAVFHTLTLPLNLPSGRGRNSNAASSPSSTTSLTTFATPPAARNHQGGPRSIAHPSRAARTRLSAIQSLTPRYNELEVALQF